MVPVPHRNSINFLGMQPKSNYLIWREMNGLFCALHKDGSLAAWVIGTGKTATSPVTTGGIELTRYGLYSCTDAQNTDDTDDTYQRNWQQHPEYTIALLKHGNAPEQFGNVQGTLLAPN